VRSRILAVVGAVLVAACGLTSSPAEAAQIKGQDTGLFFATGPGRAWDTRVNGTKDPMAPGSWLKVKVAGVAGVPASGVSAVTMNLTVAGSTTNGYLTVYPSGTSLPNASSINYVKGEARSNTITMPVGADGSVLVYNRYGQTHVILDLTGFYAKDDTIASGFGSGSGLIPVGARLVDSRSSGTPIAPGATRVVSYRPASATASTERALYLNVTVPNPTADGWVRVWSGVGEPNISTVNFRAGASAVANTTAIALNTATDRSQSFAVTNRSSAPVNFIVDVLGSYDTDVWDTKYDPFGPTRVMDTRTGTGVPKGKIPAATNRVINLPASLKGSATYGLIGNATLLNSTVDGAWVRIWDNDPPLPGISTVNADTAETIANGTVTGTNYSTGNVAIYNTKGSVDAILDATGYFAFEPASASPGQARLLRKSDEARATVAAAAAAPRS
jgi:hypothetical protein